MSHGANHSKSSAATTQIRLSTVLIEEYEAQFGPMEADARASLEEACKKDVDACHDPEGRKAFFAYMHKMAKFADGGTNRWIGRGGRSALCLSGGGIRSAAFNLGVLQRLARLKVLSGFDFLSTVSGGGYIGSWLSAWIYNQDQDVSKVQSELGVVGDAAKDPAFPEALPVRMLRRYSRFLSPRGGLQSTDTWTLIATYLRNLVLTWLVFIPMLAAIITVPRLMTALLSWIHFATNKGELASYGDLPTRWVMGGVLGSLGSAFAMMILSQTSVAVRLREISGGRLKPLKSPQAYWWWLAPTIAGCMLLAAMAAVRPLSLNGNGDWRIWAAIAVSTILYFAMRIGFHWYVSREQYEQEPARCDGVPKPKAEPATAASREPLLAIGLMGVLVIIAGSYGAVQAISDVLTWPMPLQHAVFAGLLALLGVLPALPLVDRWRQRGLLIISAVFAGVFAGLGLWASRVAIAGLHPLPPIADALKTMNADPADLWIAIVATLGPPAAIISLCLGGAVYVGFGSRGSMSWDTDLEWWARAGAMLLRLAVAWLVVFGVVLFGPMVLLAGGAWTKAAILSTGGVSGLVTVILGAGGSTPASAAGKARTSPLAWAVIKLAAPLFIVVFVSAVSLAVGCTTLLLARTFVPLEGSDLELLSAYGQFHSLSYELRWMTFVILAALVGAGLFASNRINLNRFSLHGMYCDRLIRAFLGASSPSPDRDPFTDFDDRDNIFLSKMRVGSLRVRNLTKDEAGRRELITSLAQAVTKPAANAPTRERLLWFLRNRVESSPVRARLPLGKDGSKIIPREVVDRLNDVLLYERLDDDHALDPDLPPSRERLAPQDILKNRWWIEKHLSGHITAFPRGIKAQQRPLHIINTALNIVAGSNNAWQDRKAASQTFSVYHSGSAHIGYRDIHEYGGARGTSLGAAMTISGAAVSPNQGYHSSPPIAFLLTLFNVRLGAWLGNPGPTGESKYRNDAPKLGFLPPLLDALGRTTDTDPYVYLSDGGHFDNLGLYEMVQRRCHAIVVIDAAADPSCELFDLGNAIRKIRVDLGIPIDLDYFNIRAKRPENDGPIPHEGESCGLGTIRYDVVDGKEAKSGRLLYIKPCVYWKEPADVLNYARTSPEFPHETTADQWFTEPQFESYRQLGWHILKMITQGAPRIESVDELIDRAEILLSRGSSGQGAPRPSTGM